MSSIAAGTTSTTGLVYTSDTTGNLVLKTNGTTTAVTINTSQAVGIGTSSPASPSGFAQNVTLYNASNAAYVVNANNAYRCEFGVSSGGGWLSTYDSIPLRFATSNTEVMRLDVNGNLGLGVTPSAWNSASKSIQFGAGGVLEYYSTNPQSNLYTNVYRNSTNSSIYINNGYGYYYSQINGTHAWAVAPSGTAGAAVSFNQAMTLDNSGFLYLGTTSQVTTPNSQQVIKFNNTNYYGLALQGSASGSGQALTFYNSSGTSQGSISFNGSGTTSYGTSSDVRLKTLIGVSTDTSVIDNIVINDFTWKTDGATDRGVFAQDAYKVKPSAIYVGKDDLDENGLPTNPWGVDYSKFVPDLIVYCQQLKKQLTALQAKVGA